MLVNRYLHAQAEIFWCDKKATAMTGHEKECALAALAALIEHARKHGKSQYGLRKHYREIAATICEDDDFPPSRIEIVDDNKKDKQTA